MNGLREYYLKETKNSFDDCLHDLWLYVSWLEEQYYRMLAKLQYQRGRASSRNDALIDFISSNRKIETSLSIENAEEIIEVIMKKLKGNKYE